MRIPFIGAGSAVATIAAAAIVLGACSSGDDEQAQQEQQVATAATETTTTAATTTSEPARTEPAQRAQPEPEAQSEQQAQSQAQQQPAQQAVAETSEQVDDADSEDGAGMGPGDAVAVVEAADYDSLSPHLQLLRDAGYPVYVHPDGYTIALGTPDLSTGLHRVTVVIEGPDGLVEFPAIGFTAMSQDEPAMAQDVVARFSRFPDGVRGFHVAEVNFDRSGRWALVMSVPHSDGFQTVAIGVHVGQDTLAPSIGDSVPPSSNRTLNDGIAIGNLSTGDEPDPGLYLLTVEEAIAAGQPFVVVFASPGFCTNAFCGPQAEVLSELRELYPTGVNYIHIDLYENPEAVRLGELPVETPILEEWGLHTGEWTFVVNAEGRVHARFEAFAPLEEVEAALVELLEG
jgi:hypothetical protein